MYFKHTHKAHTEKKRREEQKSRRRYEKCGWVIRGKTSQNPSTPNKISTATINKKKPGGFVFLLLLLVVGFWLLAVGFLLFRTLIHFSSSFSSCAWHEQTNTPFLFLFLLLTILFSIFYLLLCSTFSPVISISHLRLAIHHKDQKRPSSGFAEMETETEFLFLYKFPFPTSHTQNK